MKATYGFHATMTARPGMGDALVNTLLTAVAPGGPAANPECVFFLVSRSGANRDVVQVTEGWTSKEAHAANFGTAQSKAFTAKLGELVGGEATYSDDVPVGGRFSL
ncbi:MAG: antibiotic biosynthesis monooxygenase [Archangium sp.]